MVTEREWLEEQLGGLGLSSDQHSAVRNLMNCLWTARDVRRIEGEELERVLEVFEALSRGKNLVVDQTDSEDVWIPVKTGNIHMRETVRVKVDAYDGQPGLDHNGRTGVVVGVRPDDIRVKYTDGKNPTPPYVRHRTAALEKRIK